MPRRTGVQNGSAISKNMTPTLWLRLLRRNRAMAFGRYPSFFATSSMRFFVAGAMYLASGALFSTIETVAGEKPLDFATSLIVTVWLLPLCRFTGMSASAGATIILLESLMMQWAPRKRPAHSGGTSNDSGSRNQRVFHTPKAIPVIIQMAPMI